MMIAFGADGHLCDPADREEIQRHLDRLVPGYRVLDAAAHDWLRDEFSLGTWAIHRPGWYEHHYEAMCRPEGPLMLAGSDLAAGWAGFIDGAIESGLRAGAWAAATVGTASTLSRSG
jgi:monoamine oxidase